MNQQLFGNQSRRRLIVKIYVIVMTCLAGSLITIMILHFGIRGLERVHYAFMAFAAIVGTMVWTIWPKRL